MKSIARFLLAFFFIAFAGAAARSEEISSADAAAIRSIVSGQTDAFRHDDGVAAYGYASPAIRELFPTAEIFMGMVRRGYPPVYRPKSVTFGEIRILPAGPEQRVFLTGPDGKGYVAVYSLQRQPDGSWKINGCTLVEDSGPSI